TLVLAPMTPFITERVWQDLFRAEAGAPESVHLASWPDEQPSDDALATQVAAVRRLVELGRAARASSGVKTRQPLGRALVGSPAWSGLSEDLRHEIADELNVESLEPLSDGAGGLVDVSAKANFRALGKRFGKRTPVVAAAIAAADADALSQSLRAGSASVVVDGETVALEPDDVIVTESPRESWTVASEAGETVALDLTVTAELRRAGLAREVVRTLQEARKASGLDVSDRIEVRWQAEGELADALDEHAASIADEVLAVRWERGEIDPASGRQDEALGLAFSLAKALPPA
ncbi:MAG: DUF5915 domain-containing protein, partial [Candidatus Nanopelagicales bacterium]